MCLQRQVTILFVTFIEQNSCHRILQRLQFRSVWMSRMNQGRSPSPFDKISLWKVKSRASPNFISTFHPFSRKSPQRRLSTLIGSCCEKRVRNQLMAQHCAERSLRLRCQCRVGRQLKTQTSKTQQISRILSSWLSQQRTKCRSLRKQVPKRYAYCSVRRISNMALTMQWKPCTQANRLTSQHNLNITLLKQLRIASTWSLLRQNHTWVRSTSILMRSQSLLSLLRSPILHLLSFLFLRIVQPMNYFCSPTEKTLSFLAMQVMIAFAASLVFLLDRSAS